MSCRPPCGLQSAVDGVANLLKTNGKQIRFGFSTFCSYLCGAFHNGRHVLKTHTTMQHIRMQAVASMFEGLTFEQATTTQAWDTLTCDEQMHVENFIFA